MTLKPFTFLCLTIFIIISAPAWSLPANAPEKISLQLKWTHQFQFAGYYAAKEQGYYENSGLDVELIERTVDTGPIEQVMSGKAQYGISDSSIVVEFAKGTQVKALAAIFQHNPLVFITKQSSGITNPFEMKGKRIMLQDYEAYTPLRACFIGAGLRENDYIYVKHTYDNGALIRDEVDVISSYLTDAPYYFQQQGVEINIINPQDYGVDFYGDILFSSTQETIDHPDRVKRFKQATIKGWQYALTHQEELVQLIHEKYKSKLSLNALRYEAKEIAKLISADTIPLGAIEASRLLRAAEVYAQLYKTKALNINDIRSFIQPDEDIHSIILTPQEQIWLHEHPLLKFTGDPDWLPYEAFDDKGEYIGIVADHLKLIEKHSGIKFNIVATKTWQESVVKARDGDIDIISETVDSSLTEIMAFTKPYLSSPIVIVMNDKQDYVNNIAQIADKKIALIKDYGYIKHITNTYPGLDYHWVDTLQQGLEDVSSGKVDVLLSTLAHASYAISNSAIQNIRIVGKTEFTNDLALGVKKEYAPVLIPLLNRAFDLITESERKQVFDQWGKVEFAPQTDYRVVIQVSLGLLLLLSMVLYWNRTLRQQIIARKQVEDRLQEAQKYAHIGHWDLLRDSTIATWSKQMYIIFGLPPEVESGPETLCDILHASDCSRFMESLQHSFATGEEHHIEYRIRRRNDNEERWIECRGKPVIGNDGQVEKISGFIQDITERKQVESQLRESEQSLQLSQESGGIGTWEYDFITNESICSRNVFQQLKFPWSTGKSSWDDVFAAIYPEDHAHVNEVINHHISEGSDLDVEYRITDTEGDARWMRTIGKVEFDADGNPIKMRGTIQDITAQKSASEKFQLLARVFNDTQEGITITNAQKEIVDVNPAFSDITGFSREEVIGQNPRILSSGKQSPEFYAEMWQKINEFGHWQGEVWNRRKDGELYAELMTISTLLDDNGKVINYVGVFTDITHSKQQQEKLNRMAHYDVLTGLPNRALFVDRFHQAIAHSKRNESLLVVCFLDLDNFKPINDNYGHDVGDELLIEVAKRIKDCIREEDTVSRQGGDEFALLLNDIESPDQCELTIERILHALAQPYLIDDTPHNITASIGVTLYPDDNEDIDTLVRHADNAMYQAKQSGKHRYHFFDSQHDKQLVQKHHKLDEIQQALINNEFTLYYQPKVNMVTGDVFGAEALIRWIHPEHGLIPPLDFLPLIDATDLELQIGDWVINQALQQMECWLAQGIKLEVSVNIASHHLQSAPFCTNLETALAKYPAVDSQYLQLEILESSVLSDLQMVSRIIETCQEALGVSVALDDFGTGYSSLTHLRSLTANIIKIDQSFVRDMLDDPNDYTIIDGVVGLADSFNREVIAEGVETTEHGLILLIMGCKAAQGYGIAKPMPADDLPEWLSVYTPNQEWLSCGNKVRTEKENKIKLFRLTTNHWKNRFISYVQSSPEDNQHEPIMSEQHDHGGRWISRAYKEGVFEQNSLKRLERAHNNVHFIAQTIHLSYQEGNIDKARGALDGLITAYNEMSNAVGMCE